MKSITVTEKDSYCTDMMKHLDIQRRNELFCDVIVEVGSGDDQACLKAHRNVLCAASPFFYDALNSDMKDNKEGEIRLEKMSKASTEQVIDYLYSGHVEVTKENASQLGATTECRATLTSTKRAGSFGSAVDVRTMNNLNGFKCWVHIFSGSFGSFGSAVDERTMNNLNGMKCWVHIFSGSFGSFGSAVDERTMNNLNGMKCWVHIFSGSFGSFGSAVDERTMNNLNGMKYWVHIFSGSFGSFGSAVDERTMNNLYGIKCWVHIFSGSFGSFGSAVDERTMNNLNGMKYWVHIFSGSFGSFGSAVDERTMNNLYGIKCWVHIFSGSFGSAVDIRLRSINCLAVIVEFINLAVRFALMAGQWIKELEIIVIRLILL